MRRAIPALVVLAALAPACAGLRDPALSDAQQLWKQGQRDESLALATEAYRRFLGANDLEDAAVRAELQRAETSLEEDPIFVAGDAPPIVIDPGDGRSGVLAMAVQEDLASERITPVLRGLLVVRDLGLARHAATVLAIVFAERALRADGGLLEEAGTPLRNLVAKRLALDTLTRLR
ncbi:MAG: hypothetical protein H6744_12085 [Deltaproteobacteria bacterium]|nr:hypothetical protein [Deltaproteobacteria bacterium]